MRARESKLIHLTLAVWTHLLCFLLMAVYDCADAQAGTSPVLPYNFGTRENMGASFSVMVLAFLSAFAFMGFFTLYLRHCAQIYAATGNPISAAAELCRRGCNQEVINNCPIVKYSMVKELKMGKEALECAVCLAEFQDFDRLRLLPRCQHVFHPDCIDAWLSSHMTCPLCRAKLTSGCGQNPIQLLPSNMNEPQYPQNYSTRTPESASAGEMGQHQVEVEVLPMATAMADLNQQQASEQQLPAARIAITPVENGSQVFTLSQIQTPRPSPPPGLRILLERFPRSHSTGHSLLEMKPVQGNYLDRHTLTLPEHVRKQILVNHNRLRRLPTSDSVLPKVWSPRRGWYGSELGEAASSRQLQAHPLDSPPFVSSTMTPVKLKQASEASEEQHAAMSEQQPEIFLQSLNHTAEGSQNSFHRPPL